MPSHRRNQARGKLLPEAFIVPCKPTAVPRPPSGPDWLHEVKHDGYRLQIHVRDEAARLYTMNGADWTERYPAVVDAALELRCKAAIIDAEVVAAGPNTVTDFRLLRAQQINPDAFAYAFDLLAIDGEDIRSTPIEKRRAKLERLSGKRTSGIRFSEHLAGDGAAIFVHACKLGLEGIVSKKIGSPYVSGSCRTWLKARNPESPAMKRYEDETW